jgi:hypothetical protein
MEQEGETIESQHLYSVIGHDFGEERLSAASSAPQLDSYTSQSDEHVCNAVSTVLTFQH